MLQRIWFYCQEYGMIFVVDNPSFYRVVLSKISLADFKIRAVVTTMVHSKKAVIFSYPLETLAYFGILVVKFAVSSTKIMSDVFVILRCVKRCHEIVRTQRIKAI